MGTPCKLIALAMLVAASAQARAQEATVAGADAEWDCAIYIAAIERQEQVTLQRDTFVSWIFQELAYGNVTSVAALAVAPAGDAPPAEVGFAWVDIPEWRQRPMTEIFWCTFETLTSVPSVMAPNARDRLYAGLANATREAPVARFWLAYDLTHYFAAEVVARNGARLEGLPTSPAEVAPLAALRSAARLLSHSIDPAGRLLDGERRALVEDAADAALRLADAAEAEAEAARTTLAEKEENLTIAVEEQLSCEVKPYSANPNSAKRDGLACPYGGGLIWTRILKPVADLQERFRRLSNSIEGSAKKIDLLNANLMATARTMRTYTEVFSTYNPDTHRDLFTSKLKQLRANLTERGVLDETPVWTNDGAGGLRLGPDFLAASDRGSCTINEPVSVDTLEQYLQCFHEIGTAQAKSARATVIEPFRQSEDSSLPGAVRACIERQDELTENAVSECFLDWLWSVDAVAAAQLEPRFSSARNPDR